jgi:hypothetical protein
VREEGSICRDNGKPAWHRLCGVTQGERFAGMESHDNEVNRISSAVCIICLQFT